MSSRPKRRTRARRAETGGTSRPHHAHHPPPSPLPAIPAPTPSLLAPTTSTPTPLPPQASTLSNLNIGSSTIPAAADAPFAADAHSAAAPTPTPKKLIIKLVITKKQNPITLAVRIPGLSHTAPKLPATPAKSPEKLIENGKGTEKEKADEDIEEDTPLEEGTICVSEFLTEEDLKAMPSLEAPLTRKRRRASSTVETFVQLPNVKPRGRRKKDDVALENALVNRNGTASSSKVEGLKEEKKGRLKGEKLVNGVNGSNLQNDMLIEIPNGADKKKSTKPKDKEIVKEGKDGKKEKNKEEREKDLERNIDNVIFGDVTFKAWYPSWYPKEIIGEKALSCEGKGPGITVKELYICRRCFGYSKVLVEWVRHCRCCEREVPGRKVYSHGAEGEEGGWSVWEVDGGVETVSTSLSLLELWACMLTTATNSSSAKIYPSLRSSFSITNLSSSMSQASTTSSLCTPLPAPSKHK